ncbi:DUF2463 domain-containing protein [Encephalitozoon cuniculi]|nr:DUF2463 domain-containing protein [Encephalitozoon cuniculi]
MKISEPPAISKPTRDESELIRMYLKTIICDFKAPMLIAFPILMGLVLKETVKSSLFLRFIIMLLPFSYSALECFLLFRNNLESSYRSELHKMPCSIFNVLLIAFSVISILSIAIFPLSAWSNNDVSSYSMLLPCLIVPLTYMLSISCSLVSGSILFTDTGIDILIDASLLLCTLLLLVFWDYRIQVFSLLCFCLSHPRLNKIVQDEACSIQREFFTCHSMESSCFWLYFSSLHSHLWLNSIRTPRSHPSGMEDNRTKNTSLINFFINLRTYTHMVS